MLENAHRYGSYITPTALLAGFLLSFMTRSFSNAHCTGGFCFRPTHKNVQIKLIRQRIPIIQLFPHFCIICESASLLEWLVTRWCSTFNNAESNSPLHLTLHSQDESPLYFWHINQQDREKRARNMRWIWLIVVICICQKYCFHHVVGWWECPGRRLVRKAKHWAVLPTVLPCLPVPLRASILKQIPCSLFNAFLVLARVILHCKINLSSRAIVHMCRKCTKLCRGAQIKN